MVSTPYIVGLTIQYPAGTPLANVNVTVRVESTNESHTETTNASGEAVFNLGSSDFPSGYSVGDVFSYAVLYKGYETYGSHTITSTPFYTATVVLTAVPTSPSLRYFTPQEFLDFFNVKIYEDDAENGVKMQQLVKIGAMVEKMIDSETESIFDDNGGSYYSQSEYIDTDEFQQIYHTSKIPVVSVTSCYTTQGDSDTYPDYTNNTTGWSSLTEGTDFVIDLEIGRIQITNSSYYPISRKWGLYIVYTYGRSSVPEDIKELAIIETGLKMFGASFIKSKIYKFSDVDVGDMTWFNSYKKGVLLNYSNCGVSNWNT